MFTDRGERRIINANRGHPRRTLRGHAPGAAEASALPLSPNQLIMRKRSRATVSALSDPEANISMILMHRYAVYRFFQYALCMILDSENLPLTP